VTSGHRLLYSQLIATWLVAGAARAAVAVDLADAAGPAAIDAAATSSAPAQMNSRAGFISCSLRRA
jgi:hypothetical protein